MWFEYQLDNMISSVELKLENLSSLHIFSTLLQYAHGHLGQLRLESEERAMMATSLGENEFFSSVNSYRHLNLLESLVFKKVIKPQELDKKYKILNMRRLSQAQLSFPTFSKLGKYALSGAFVFEVDLNIPEADIPQAACELYVYGRRLWVKAIRGAVTNGRGWIFLLLNFNDNYDGVYYLYSAVVRLTATYGPNGTNKILKRFANVIAGVLLHWIINSFSSVGTDDWFEVE
ncbi:hypothetical protein BJ912DRAFT_930803 [Pholiota molesta]|nr:hypothetical protein BJ912DRAFT_930803 [Pholiota molesta]